MKTRSLLMVICVVGCQLLCDSEALASEARLAGDWKAQLETPGGPLSFGLQLSHTDSWTARVTNGPETIDVPDVTLESDKVTIAIAHYDSRIVAHFYFAWKKNLLKFLMD